jgi:lipopolysaccharide biosynthesis glycosyltransferase
MQLNDNTCPIVFVCDDAYSMPLATALRSIVDANTSGRPCDFHVLTDGISANNKRRIFESLPKGSASIRWVDIDLDIFSELNAQGHMSKMTFARLLIPRIFPDAVSKVLYLDTDILVLDDLKALCEADFRESVVAAVLDKIVTSEIDKPGWEQVPRVREYFNAGVLLINLKRWRELEISEKAMEYLMAHPDSRFCDQDGLNVACDGLWTKLDSRWNFLDFFERKNLAQLNVRSLPGIVHFVTYEKPWKVSSLHANAKFYDSFRSRTCFARTPLDKQQDALIDLWLRLKRRLRPWLKPIILWLRPG